MRTTLRKHVILPAVASIAAVLAGGGIAAAHVDPDPLAMEADTTATVAFGVEHGCDGSPTTGVKIQIPPGVTGVSAVDKPGWTATVTGDVVEFTGGSLGPDTPDHFDVTLTAPEQPGTINFPFIQTCEQGELAWIEIAAEGAAEPERPAPALKITQGPPTSADLTPAPEEEEGTNDTVVATGDTSGVTATAAPVVATVADPSDDSDNTGTIVVIVVAAVVVVGAAVVIARRRSSGSTS